MNVGGLLGLTFGIIFGLAGLYFGKKEAKKNRGDDEVNEFIWQKTRSLSWYVTTVGIYLLLLLVLLGVEISTAKALSVLLLIHLFSWAIVGIYLSSYYYNESKADAQIYKILLGFFAVLGIVFITVMFVFF